MLILYDLLKNLILKKVIEEQTSFYPLFINNLNSDIFQKIWWDEQVCVLFLSYMLQTQCKSASINGNIKGNLTLIVGGSILKLVILHRGIG